VGIAARSETPCVGDPVDWDNETGGWFTCAACGEYAVCGLAPDGLLSEPMRPGHEGDPVLIVVSACKVHLRAVRGWLKAQSPYFDDPVVCSTDYLREHFSEMFGDLDVPKLAPLRVTA
jgi:hypothetical protein